MHKSTLYYQISLPSVGILGVALLLCGCSDSSSTLPSQTPNNDGVNVRPSQPKPAEPAPKIIVPPTQARKVPDCTDERRRLNKFEAQILGIKSAVDEIRQEADSIMAQENASEEEKSRLYQLGDKVEAFTKDLELLGTKRDALRRVMESKGCSAY